MSTLPIKEQNRLVSVLKSKLKMDATINDAYELLVVEGEKITYAKLRPVFDLLKRRHPELFTRRAKASYSSTEIGAFVEHIASRFPEAPGPSIAQIQASLDGLGHQVSQATGHKVQKLLKLQVPSLYPDPETASEIAARIRHLLADPSNPMFKEIQEAAKLAGTPITPLMAKDVHIALSRMSSEADGDRPKKKSPRRKKPRKSLRLNLTETDSQIFDEFTKMVGANTVDGLALLARSVVYLTVVHQINLPEVIREAKAMTPEVAHAYSKVFSKINLTNP